MQQNKQHENHSFKLKSKAILSVLELINKQFWMSKFAPVFIFGFSLVFVIIFGFTMLAVGNELSFKQALPGGMAIMTMSAGVIIAPLQISEFKKSVLLKRIGATPISAMDFIMTIIGFYFILMIIQILWMLMWTYLVFGWFNTAKYGIAGGIDQPLKDIIFNTQDIGIPINGSTVNDPAINFGQWFFTEIFAILLALSIGLIIVALTGSSTNILTVSLPIFLISMILSGQLFSIAAISRYSFLVDISYISPVRYSTGLINTAWSGHSIFDMSKAVSQWTPGGVPGSDSSKAVYQIYDLWLDWFVTSFLIIGLNIITIKNFSWNAR